MLCFVKPFVLKHAIQIIEGEPNSNRFDEYQIWFAALLTTKRLLRNAVHARFI